MYVPRSTKPTKVGRNGLLMMLQTLQSAVQRIEAYVKNLETEVKAPKK